MSDLPFYMQPLPAFKKIKTSEVDDAISNIISSNNESIKELLRSNNIPTNWNNSIMILEELSIKLANAWSILSHLNSVCSSEETRTIYEKSLKKIVQYSLNLEQNPDISLLYKNILYNFGTNLNKSQKVLLEKKILDFKLSGVDLEASKKTEFKKLAEDISKLSSKFNYNVMDSTDSWLYHIADKNLILGISDEIINLAEEKARSKNKEGYLFGLDAPTYLAIMKGAKNRDLRKALHYAYTTRASLNGPHDPKYNNEQIIFDILYKKNAQSELLSFNNYAEYSLANKMVKDPDVVINFLTKLLKKACNAAKKELEELKLFAKNCKDGLNSTDNLQPWDIAYYSELQKNKNFKLSDDQLKKYFNLDKVLSGLFEIIYKLYKVNFKLNTKAETWHEDVQCYDLFDKEYNIIGHIYIDLFARSKKKCGAWMDECRVRCFSDNIKQLPVAYLTCNFTAPVNTDNSKKHIFLHHNEVVTLFHEFGHCLQHLLTNIDYPTLSGINGVPWDAVELASQFHENYCWDKEGINLISEHVDTKESLHDEYVQQLIKQKNYQSGLFLIRQLVFALFDMKLHIEFNPELGIGQIRKLLNHVREEVGVIPYADYDNFHNSFSHIFAGGYSAGYYSYLWAELLAANCFEKLNSSGDIFNEQLGMSFLTNILSTGGSIDYTEAVESFCGHKVESDYLLNGYGII